MLRELLRRVDMMVILENKLDALVRLHTPLPPGMIGGADSPGSGIISPSESLSGPNAGLTEVLVPAGYVTTVYDPVFKLTSDGTRYVSTPSDDPDHAARARDCRSRSCFAPSRARKTYFSRSRRPTKTRAGGEFLRPRFRRYSSTQEAWAAIHAASPLAYGARFVAKVYLPAGDLRGGSNECFDFEP